VRRYWLEIQTKKNEDLIQISGESFHHIFDVCRQDVGSQFEVLFGDQKAHLVQVISKDKKQASAKILSSRSIPALPLPHLHLCLGVSRYPVMDAVVEKAVEMGVHTLTPVLSDFTFVRRKDSVPDNKIERWQKIITSATQQCGRGERMILEEPRSLEDLVLSVNQSPLTQGLFLYEGQGQMGLQQALKGLNQKIEKIMIFVGSEGGYSSTEVQLFQQFGLQAISLGQQVLRVETACISALAILKYDLGLMAMEDSHERSHG
jgi:16S rRNA (uracil1498-N3)-methyltransferase